MTNPNRKLQPVSNSQMLIKLSCGHNVKANEDILDFMPIHQVPMVQCEQCDREMINGLPAVEIRAHYSNVTGVRNLENDDVRNVQGGLPFIMFDKLVYVSLEQSREFNGGL